MKSKYFVFLISIQLISSPAIASSDSAWAALDKASAKACIAETEFLKAKVSAPTRFSDGIGYDVRIVSGVYPQPHMKGAQGQMLCLFSRKTKNVEVQELAQ
jgi:hypothetical protein